MGGLFFEDFHKASKDFPYFDSNMRNINYISHFHEEIEVISVQKGEVDINGENGDFTAHSGDICVFMPGEIHSFSSKHKNHLYVMKIYCKNTVEKTDFSKYRFSPNLVKCGSELNSVLSPLISSISEENKNKSVGYAYLINSLSNRILWEILRSDRVEEIDASLSKKHISALSLLENVNTYIENHYREPILLRDIAKFCNFFCISTLSV